MKNVIERSLIIDKSGKTKPFNFVFFPIGNEGNGAFVKEGLLRRASDMQLEALKEFFLSEAVQQNIKKLTVVGRVLVNGLHTNANDYSKFEKLGDLWIC